MDKFIENFNDEEASDAIPSTVQRLEIRTTGLLESNILKLNDNILIRIFEKCDMTTLLNLMQVCRLFESLISSSDYEFYENFELKLNAQLLTENSDNLMSIRRKFYTVKIFNFHEFDDSNFKVLLTTFEKIGAYVRILKIESCVFCTSKFVELLANFRNMIELKLERVEFLLDESAKRPTLKCDFVQLSTLQFCSVKNCDFLGDLFTTVDLLHLKVDDTKKDWKTIQKILYRQKYLSSLELSRIVVKRFEFSPESWNCENIYRLSIKEVIFTEPESFENFTTIIKKLKNVSKLDLDIYEDEQEIGNCYVDILSHILSLKSLESLELCLKDPLEILPSLKIENKNLKYLTFNRLAGNVNFESLFKSFPIVRKLSFNSYILFRPEIFKDMTSFKHLKEASFHWLYQEMLPHIKGLKLENFTAISLSNFTNPGVWRTFAKNNQSVKQLKLPFVLSKANVIEVEHFENILESFSFLNILKIHVPDTDLQSSNFTLIQQQSKKDLLPSDIQKEFIFICKILSNGEIILKFICCNSDWKLFCLVCSPLLYSRRIVWDLEDLKPLKPVNL